MKQETGRLKEILHVLNQHNVTHGINPEKLCSILEDLGPTYVKLGQIMSRLLYTSPSPRDRG